MWKNWLLLLFSVLVLIVVGCRKHKGSPAGVPGLPDDSIPQVPGEPGGPSTPIYNQIAVHSRINNNTGGYYEALPPDYVTTDKKYPLLVFLHGGGELGSGNETDLPKILKNSLTRRLAEKTFPISFTVDGREFSFIIISPQFQEWPENKDVLDVINYSRNKYRVDTTRIYLSGLSMGGGATWEFAGTKEGKMLAAIVPICGASWADSATARQIAANEIPSWAFHNEDDAAVTVYSTTRYARLINAENPKYPVKVTLWPTGGHDAWTKASDPEYEEDGKNMYEWLLQYVREGNPD